MQHTFNLSNNSIKIACKAWSDFAAHLPLIRSFSFGKNFPPQYPLFSGQPIRYHFFFYFLVAQLEKIGLALDWALNLPSALGFFFLITSVFLFSRKLFKSRAVSILSVVLLLFNGSLGFFYFFAENQPVSIDILNKIINNRDFYAFAPYDDSLISGGFWNLNVFTNQRHFALAIGLLLTLVLWAFENIRKKSFNLQKGLLVGLLVGILPFIHGTAFICAIIIFGSIFFLFDAKKTVALGLIVALIIFLPQLWYLKSGDSQLGARFEPGYLVHNQLNPLTFIRYWFLNLGLGLLLIPAGFLTANKRAKKVFLVFLPVFIVANVFQFGPDMATNHKFFNIWLAVGNMFSAHLLVLIWRQGNLAKTLVLITCFLLTLSGLIDFFAIKNDRLCLAGDSQANQDVNWIKNHTPPEAIFLNTSYLYHPANLAGRKIFLGWPYFPWSAGYDTNLRDNVRKSLLVAKAENKHLICRQLRQYQIDYLALGENNPENLKTNSSFFDKNFIRVYYNPQTNLKIFDIKKSCR